MWEPLYLICLWLLVIWSLSLLLCSISHCGLHGPPSSHCTATVDPVGRRNICMSICLLGWVACFLVQYDYFHHYHTLLAICLICNRALAGLISQGMIGLYLTCNKDIYNIYIYISALVSKYFMHASACSLL